MSTYSDFGDGSDGWSFLSRDAFKIMLGECPGEKPASELGEHSYVAYLIVESVDQFHAEVAERGAEVLSQPATEPWGLREFSIRTPEPRPEIVFPSEIGTALDDSNVRKVFRAICEKAELRHRSPHDMRHTFANAIPARGCSARLREQAARAR